MEEERVNISYIVHSEYAILKIYYFIPHYSNSIYVWVINKDSDKSHLLCQIYFGLKQYLNDYQP